MAVALAAQDSLKNLFGFIMIVLDQPFKVGERISFEGHDGVIEEVGLRSVRMRRLDGHLVTIPNQMAADKMIHNIARRPFISRLMDIGITYDTPVEKVKKAVEIVKDILKDHEGMNPDYPPRVFFKDFKADSLNIFAIYWYFPPSYWDFMAHCEYVNLEILKRFNKAGIEFAFPTQTVYLAGDEKRKLVLKHDRLDEIFGKIDIKG
jgi:MscS family membrane protein